MNAARGTRATLFATLFAAAMTIAAPATQAADGVPVFRLVTTALPSNFLAGASGQEIILTTVNVGGAPTDGTVTITDDLPAGVTVSKATMIGSTGCSVLAGTVTCTFDKPIPPGRETVAAITLDIDTGLSGSLVSEASVEGGGALPVAKTAVIPISSTPPPYGFLPGEAGFSAPLSAADGSAATQAGSHPYHLLTELGFPVEKPGVFLNSAGHLRDATVDLPPGQIVNPSSTTALCTVAQQNSPGSCPPASQIGVATVITPSLSEGVLYGPAPLYNMVPDPGTPSKFGFDAVNQGIFVAITGSLRSDGDYGLSGSSTDVLARGPNPILSVRLDFWGDPSHPSHDALRGACGKFDAGLCPATEPSNAPLLTMPVQCTGLPTITHGRTDSWEEPGIFREASYESADLEGNRVAVDACNQLDFEPTISSKPTTNLTDSPSGLDFTLHQPQDLEFSHRSQGALQDATVILPNGLAVNPSQADGLDACSNTQIGLTTAVGETPIHFTKDPDTCPAASKLGKVEVTTPLLVQTDESGTKFAFDPESGKPIPRPLHGSVYLAEPLHNPFGSLLAIYLSIDDPRSGTVAKLAGEVIPDPATGQLTTRFEDNPQLPLEDVTLHLFGGARGALITPPSCGPHITGSELTPWSSPESPDAHPQSSFQLSAASGGGPCPASAEQAPDAPAFSAGTIAPQAAAYSPFVLKLSREDGTQRLTGFDTLLPPGLTGKLAGIPACSDAALAAAASRSKPSKGIIERQSPSCPQASALGTVTAGVGAGPTPFYTNGTAYLAGPYKGAPLSMAVITPAIAGPFDLGTVVVRAALNLDRETAQIHAVSDPFPTILHGIPLDLRSVAAHLDRPQFTLNPTSCDPMAITGSATSIFNQIAPLSQRFQVGGCPELAFKPKFSLALKGSTKRASNPRLIANLTYPNGGAYANIAKAQVKLPPSAFLDNSHINTICTRVQFTADTCPLGSIYGKASATSPLLDYPVSGAVYLRSSSHPLPDLVVKLKGPESQPIEVDLVGKTDSVKGALRNTFEAVPDAPVSKFHLELFGGKRGLVELSRNLCAHVYRAEVDLTAQNGKTYDTKPTVGNSCKDKRHGKGHRKPGAKR